MFSARLNRAENIANLAPCPGSNLTRVHQLRLSRNWFPWRTTTTTRFWWSKQVWKKCAGHLNPRCETETVSESLVRICTSCSGLNVAFRLVLLQVTTQVIPGIFWVLEFVLRNSWYENSECEGVSKRKKSSVVLVIRGYATLYNNEGPEIAHEMRSLKTQPGNSWSGKHFHDSGGVKLKNGQSGMMGVRTFRRWYL